MGTVLELTKRGAKGIARYLSTTKGDNNSNGKMKMRKKEKKKRLQNRDDSRSRRVTSK